MPNGDRQSGRPDSTFSVRLLQAEIIPRLLIACRASLGHFHAASSPPDRPRAGGSRIAASDLERLTLLLLDPDGGEVSPFIDARVQAGVTAEALLSELLAPAARRLGTLWEADECDFVHVTIGLHRLQEAVQKLLGDDEPSPLECESGRALLLTAPDETHRFGLEIVDRDFRSAGWRVERCEATELEFALSGGWLDLVGFSISCHRHLSRLREAIELARLASRNPAIFVLVGGPIIAAEPELARSVGADLGAVDAEEAIVLAGALLKRRARV